MTCTFTAFHSYFIRPGQDDSPILYHVDRIRDGRSFATRMVKSIQRGENILSMLVSFHGIEDQKLEHQYVMPQVPLPDKLMSYDELIMKKVGEMDGMDDRTKRYIERYLNKTTEDVPIEIKPVEPHKFSILRRFSKPTSHEANNNLWVRVRGHIDADNHKLHRCAAAYLSDWTLLGTALLPLPVDSFNINMIASLDHSMWFHNHFRADEWMLYECESPRMIGGRALTLGRLWRQDGTLAVSVAQEGIIRASSPSKL
ncbi:hypothetical protein CAPTEDRAFT_18472 [Capitella teleta]|uniref:Acyl-CoA thioesterase II domain-containing protein n=1 Tax=Capitella teleta TaxID=283909 RepID=R7UV46_CAPTE|nr:hypothetical protein CAPTEDRAFT_18472 [Capitella teleta]|eukprot:ELU10040.1 hypothetical protein CAPTEDRAFT_18472 [Capitella teleta]